MARSVPMLHPSVKPFINAVITLATPWPASPFLWEESVAEFYKQLRVKKSPDFVLFSICGGLRDELIPPGLCASSAVGGIAVSLGNQSIFLVVACLIWKLGRGEQNHGSQASRSISSIWDGSQGYHMVPQPTQYRSHRNP